MCVRAVTIPRAGERGLGVMETFVWLCCVYSPTACRRTCRLSKVKKNSNNNKLFSGSSTAQEKASGSSVLGARERQAGPSTHRFPKEHVIPVTVILYLSQDPIQQGSKWKITPDGQSLRSPPPRLSDPRRYSDRPDRVGRGGVR